MYIIYAFSSAPQNNDKKIKNNKNSKLNNGNYKIKDVNGTYEIIYDDKNGGLEAEDLLSSLDLPKFLNFVQKKKDVKLIPIFIAEVVSILNHCKANIQVRIYATMHIYICMYIYIYIYICIQVYAYTCICSFTDIFRHIHKIFIYICIYSHKDKLALYNFSPRN
jgi:hypothetical protein